MAWTRIANVKAGSGDGNSVTTSGVGVDTTGADLIVLVVSQESGVADVTVSDSGSNVWTQLTEQVEGAGRAAIYYTRPTSLGAGHTFTASQAGSSPGICVEAWRGSRFSPFDQENGAHNSDAGATIATGSITPTVDGCLVIAAAASRGQSADSLDGGFTLGNTQAPGASNDAAAIAYLVQVAAAAANPTWTFSAAGGVKIGMIASFKPSGLHRMFSVF